VESAAAGLLPQQLRLFPKGMRSHDEGIRMASATLLDEAMATGFLFVAASWGCLKLTAQLFPIVLFVGSQLTVKPLFVFLQVAATSGKALALRRGPWEA